MKQCISCTMLGEKAYELKHIEKNEGISINKLRRDIRNNILVPSGKTLGAYYIIQSELDKYLDVVKKRIKLSEKQVEEMKHCLGLNYSKKPYRNKFYCYKNDENWNDLVKKGLAEKYDYEDDKAFFRLNKLGVAYILGKSLSVAKYKSL